MTMPRRSISNIAWPAECDDEALDLAGELGFTGIELAPAKVFGPLDAVDPQAVRDYRTKLEQRGFAIPALQAILFGVADVHLFADVEKRERLAARLGQVAVLAEDLGARACVFGSPSVRDPGEIDAGEAWRIAVDFFGGVARVFADRGVTLCLEANPALYQCRFVTHTQQAMALVREVDREGFGLQLDLGTVFINDEGGDVVEEAAGMAAHCHVSEPNLAAVGAGDVAHEMAAAALARSGHDGWRSIEMRAAPDWRAAMERAAETMRNVYF